MPKGGRWSRYYDAVQERPPRDTLIFALDRFAAEGMPAAPRALDLGCGDGRDTVELLRRGWRTLAMDATPEAIDRLLARPDLPKGPPASGSLETLVARFEDFQPPPADLINANFCLPFCEVAAFPDVWRRLTAAIRPGGRFAGQLFGPQDDWAQSGVIIHSRVDIDRLAAGFEIELLQEVREEGGTPLARTKHWHIFHLVLKSSDKNDN